MSCFGKRPDETIIGHNAGFTLIEVLAVLVIMGIVMAISLPNLKSQVVTAGVRVDAANIQLLEGAVKQFRLDTGGLPADLNYLVENPEGGIPGWAGPYLSKLPNSPGGNSYELNPVSGKVSVQ